MLTGQEIAAELDSRIQGFNKALYNCTSITDTKPHIKLAQEFLSKTNSAFQLLTKIENINQSDLINFISSCQNHSETADYFRKNSHLKRHKTGLIEFFSLPEQDQKLIASIAQEDIYTVGYLFYTMYLLYILATLKIMEIADAIDTRVTNMYASTHNNLERKIESLDPILKMNKKTKNRSQSIAIEQATGINKLVTEFIKEVPQYTSLKDEKIIISLYQAISNSLLIHAPTILEGGKPQAIEETFKLVKNFRLSIVHFLEKVIDKKLQSFKEKFNISQSKWLKGGLFSAPTTSPNHTVRDVLQPIIEVLDLLEIIYKLELANFDPNSILTYSVLDINLKMSKKLAVTKFSDALKKLCDSQGSNIATNSLKNEIENIISSTDAVVRGTLWRASGLLSSRVNTVINLLLTAAKSHSQAITQRFHL